MHAFLGSIVLFSALLAAPGEVELRSPGLTPSKVTAAGELVEDWGAVRLQLRAEGHEPAAVPAVSAFRLDGVVPAARAVWCSGPVTAVAEVFRAPAFPAGLDLMTLRLESEEGVAAKGRVTLDLPEGVRVGGRAAFLGSRRVLVLPDVARAEAERRAWGHRGEAAPLPGWGQPKPGFDPAFANVRAGMGGVPIAYRFAIDPRAEATVILGFCESYWSNPGGRVMSCKVEGAPVVIVDPLRRWGQHQPGGIAFEAKDASGDGVLDVLVLPARGTPDRNPILSAIWLFEPELEVDPAQVIRGRRNGAALRYVDAGGDPDQPIVPGGKAELPFALPAGGSIELTFLVACRGTSLPNPEKTAWTPEKLRAAAREVWEDWPD